MTDISGRFGGEEFLIGLIETDLTAAKEIAERIRTAIERASLEVDNKSCALTISVGVASIGADEETIEQLIDRADRALYRAKAGGRNRVVVAAANSELGTLH
jgi:two-component system cell cycle response regulator